MDGIGILLQSQHYGWVAHNQWFLSPSPWLWEEPPQHIINFTFPVMALGRNTALFNISPAWDEGLCRAVLVPVAGWHLTLPCCVCCRCQCSGPWTWWWKPAHGGYLPMPTRITSTPSPSTVTMRPTCLQTTCASTCGTWRSLTGVLVSFCHCSVGWEQENCWVLVPFVRSV